MHQNLPLISILVPSYAWSRYLPKAVRSALAQNYQHTEILVLDDAGPTAPPKSWFLSLTILACIIRHATNLGIAGHWRDGITAASEDYFCLLHDDDLLLPNFLQSLIEPPINDPETALPFCDQAIPGQDQTA